MASSHDGLGGISSFEELANTGFDVFEIPEYKENIISSRDVEFRLFTVLDSNGPLEFVVTPSSSEFTALSLTRIHGSCQILNKDGTPIEEDNVSICNMFSHSIFSQIDLELDGQTLTVSDHLYPYKAYLETLLSYGSDAKNSHLTSSLFIKDTAYQFEDTTGFNLGYNERKEIVKKSKLFDFSFFPHVDFFQTSRYLPPGCGFKLKLTRTKDAFSIMSNSGKEFMVKIHSLSLFVHRIQAAESAQKAFEQSLNYKNALYPITKSCCKKITIPSGLTNANTPNIIHGKLPRQLVIAFTLSESMAGKFGSNPFLFSHFDCTFLTLRVNGLQQPSKPLRPDFKNKLVNRELRALYDNIGILTQNQGCLITPDDYCGGYTIFCFDLCHDRTNGEHDHQSKTGTIDLEVSFGTPLPAAISLLCYAAYDTVVAITKERNVIAQ